jgi:PleD family two-component response regulator
MDVFNENTNEAVNGSVTEKPQEEIKKRRRVVLVDDVSFYLKATKERLKKYYEIYTANSADSLFELLERIRADVILLDIYLPDIDGFEIIKRLKEHPEYALIPVIFLTSKNDKESLMKAMHAGAVDLIRKPFSDPELIECIEHQFDPKIQEKNKPIILAVDDNQSILSSLKYYLGKQYTLYTLTQPERCKELIKMITPDLFLLDCKMPILNGFDLIPIIRGFNEHQDTPIIFLTSDNSMDTVSAAINFGVCDFIVKPLDGAMLCIKMSQHLKNYLMYRRLRALK